MCTRRHGLFILSLVAIGISMTAMTAPVGAGLVALQSPTATFSQGNFPVQNILDPNPVNGWALFPNVGADQAAVVETVADLGFASGTELTFTLEHLFPGRTLSLGRFRLSVTTDSRSTFADGLSTGGDVTANWTVLDPLTFSTTSGATITKLSDSSLLLSGINPTAVAYSVTAQTTLTGITGFRLEALADPSLPGNGPGRNGDGNFLLTQFVVDAIAVPEPSTFVLAGLALISLVGFGVRKRNQ